MSEAYYHIPGGFTPMFDMVKNDPNLDDAEKKVYCHIIRRSQNAFGKCTEGLPRMAQFLEFSEDYCGRVITRLKSKGYIERSGNGSNRKLWPIQLYGGTANGQQTDVEPPSYLRQA